MKKRTLVVGAAGVALAVAFAVGVAVGQNTPPAEARGVKIDPPTALPLGPEIDSVEGRQLRLRVVRIEPGGAVPMHTHKGRPGVAYVLKGTLTEHLENGDVHERREGEGWAEGKDTTHWAENRTDQALVVVAVDVFKP